MTGRDGMADSQDRQDSRGGDRTPALEWIAAGIGLILTLAMLGFIGHEAWTARPDDPPAVTVQVQRVVPAAGGWVAQFTARNHSAATAAGVLIEAELQSGDRVVDKGQATLDYLPGHSERRGGLFLRADPQAHGMEIRALGYAEP